MDEKDFELLEALSRSSSITRAAEQLFLTQSALTKRIQTLEKELGHPLLLRSRQGVRFTEAGEAAAEGARRAAAALQEMRQALEAQGEEPGGTLRLGVSMNYATYRLPEVLTQYHQKYPRVRLQLSTGHSRHLYRQLLEGTLDCAILRGEYQWDGFRHLLSQEYLCVICASQYAYTPLSQYPYIDRETDSGMATQMMRWMRENRVFPGPQRITVDSLGTCIELAERGLGWAIAPEIGLDGFKGSIRRCTFEDGEPFLRRTWFLSQQEALQLRQVEAFAKHVIGGLPPK